MLGWLFGSTEQTEYDELEKDEVYWIYCTHADGSVVRHMSSGPTEIYEGGRWVRCQGSFGAHPLGVRSVGNSEIERGKRPKYLSRNWN